MVWKSIRNRGEYPDLALTQAALATVIIIVGLLVLRAAIRARSAARRAEMVRLEHAAAPWMWREDWAGRRVAATASTTTRALWLFAIIWNLISIPIVIGVLPRELESGNRMVLLALVFPLVGILLLAGAMRATWRRLRFGKSFFVLNTLPVAVGRSLQGSIEIDRPISFAPDDLLRVSLCCIRRIVRGSGKHRSVTENAIWEGQQDVSAAMIMTSSTVAVAPVRIDIPAGLPETDTRDERDTVLWRLTATAAVAGVDYHAAFELPVFGGATGAAPIEAAALVDAPDARRERPADALVVEVRGIAGSELQFPRRFELGVAFGFFVIVLILIASGVTILFADGSIFVAFLCLVVGTILGYVALDALLGSGRVVVDQEKVVVMRRIPPIAWRKELPRISIRRAGTSVKMQGGTPFYSVELQTAEGRRIACGKYIRSKAEAEWAAQRIENALGLSD